LLAAAGLGKVAVLIIGQLRGYFQSTEKTQQFLIDPLKRDFGQVDIYMCIDKPNGPKMKDKKVAGITPTFVREYASRTMFLRMKQCYVDVLAHAKQNGIRYDWWVRTRPDLIYYHNLPTVTEVGGRTDTIYARSRRVGAGTNFVHFVTYKTSFCT